MKTRVVVYVEGGCVTSVMSNDPSVECVIFDHDNIDFPDDAPEFDGPPLVDDLKFEIA